MSVPWVPAHAVISGANSERLSQAGLGNASAEKLLFLLELTRVFRGETSRLFSTISAFPRDGLWLFSASPARNEPGCPSDRGHTHLCPAGAS